MILGLGNEDPISLVPVRFSPHEFKLRLTRSTTPRQHTRGQRTPDAREPC